MNKILKKIGRIYATEKAIKNNKVLTKYITEQFKDNVSIKKVNTIEYQVYGSNKKEYLTLLEKIKHNLETMRD